MHKGAVKEKKNIWKLEIDSGGLESCKVFYFFSSLRTEIVHVKRRSA